MMTTQTSAEQIVACFLRYVHALDNRHWADAAAQFSPQGVLAFGSDETTGHREIAKRIESDLSRYVMTWHSVATPLVEIDGDRARLTAASSGIHLREPASTENATIIGGRYNAWLSRTETGWLIDRVAPDYLWRAGPPLDH